MGGFGPLSRGCWGLCVFHSGRLQLCFVARTFNGGRSRRGSKSIFSVYFLAIFMLMVFEIKI